jgi:hypothetical protein
MRRRSIARGLPCQLDFMLPNMAIIYRFFLPYYGRLMGVALNILALMSDVSIYKLLRLISMNVTAKSCRHHDQRLNSTMADSNRRFDHADESRVRHCPLSFRNSWTQVVSCQFRHQYNVKIGHRVPAGVTLYGAWFGYTL